jgi:hypothetical protein
MAQNEMGLKKMFRLSKGKMLRYFTFFSAVGMLLLGLGCSLLIPDDDLYLTLQGGTPGSPTEIGIPVYPGGEHTYHLQETKRGEKTLTYTYSVPNGEASAIIAFYVEQLVKKGWVVVRQKIDLTMGASDDPHLKQFAELRLKRSSHGDNERLGINLSVWRKNNKAGIMMVYRKANTKS